MLIRDAELPGGGRADLRIDGGVVAAIGPRLDADLGEALIEARGAALVPGLHDHHLHLRAYAAALRSLRCGPPQVNDAPTLAARLRAEDRPGAGWLRGIGYHPSVAGEIDRDWLDAQMPRRLLRIQHRSGRLWILNSAALAWLEARGALAGTPPLERRDGRWTGRLFDADGWLRAQLGDEPPDLGAASRALARRGVTGITDTTPANDAATLDAFAAARRAGVLMQRLRLMGGAGLDGVADRDGVTVGEHKFHLHDSALPEFETLCAQIRAAHAAGRGAAFHCVSRTELVYALAALRAAGAIAGDRIEHAGVAPPELRDEVRALGLTVVTQPSFVRERGDAYLREVEADDRPWLYRLRSWLEAGVPLAGSTDAPFGEADPWSAMQAAVDRRTARGGVLGAGEALSPEQALALFTTPAAAPGGAARRIEPGARADLCLLDRPWSEARRDLAAVSVRLTLIDGAIAWHDV